VTGARVRTLEKFAHKVHDVEVVLSCSCGRCFHGETEQHAIDEWVAHVDDEQNAVAERHALERGPK